MARVVVSYDGVSIQTASVVIQEVQHESVDYKSLNIQSLGNLDGGKLVSVNFRPKVIRLTGYIKDTTQAAAEADLDTLKALVSRTQKNLDISYAGSTRRYVCSMGKVTVDRRSYNLSFIDFELEFTVTSSPFARTVDTSTISGSFTSTGTYQFNATFNGTAPPEPKITVTVTSQTAMTELSVRNVQTGDTITITRTFANSDVVVIDLRREVLTVTVNGTAFDYTGFLPEFVAGGNDLRFHTVASAVNLAVKIQYYPSYL